MDQGSWKWQVGSAAMQWRPRLAWCVMALALAISVGRDQAWAQDVQGGPAEQTAAEVALPFEEPIFDHVVIQNAPLDLKVLDERVENGVIARLIEFTGEDRLIDGKTQPVRVHGIMLLPEGNEPVPGLLWCQGGMAPAGTHIPVIYARKGYACINITLPHDTYPAWAPWDANFPKAANLTRYAHLQMRAITALLEEPRVDAERIGVAGASYGGFFSTLIAGADPRVKAGASFFAGGHHAMGTNLPQFTRMDSADAAAVWQKTIDPAWRHEHRDVPFLWTLPTNDNWFYFPAVVETYRRARTQDKVLAIVPGWTHGFPRHVDQQIFDWFDVHLTGEREPYIKPSPLDIERTPDGLVATWRSDSRPMKEAHLVVSPNAPGPEQSPWTGQWVHRLHQPFAATLSDDGMTATATVPVLDPTQPMLVYGNVLDEQDVVSSTLPVLLRPDYPADSPRGEGQWHGAPWGALEVADIHRLRAMGTLLGRADTDVAYRGQSSLRFAVGQNERQRMRPHRYKLLHVPGLPHQLSLALRSEQPMQVKVAVVARPPANWDRPAVKAIMGQQPEALDKPSPVAEQTLELGPDWQALTLAVPAATQAIEGYELQLQLVENSESSWWLDAVSFTPVVPD